MKTTLSPKAPTREETLAVVQRSIRREPLRTGDGRLIYDYVDGHAVLGDPTGLAGCCELICERLLTLEVGAVAGEVSAACGLVSGVVLRRQQTGMELLGRYVRKEAKRYGVTGLLNTELPPRGPVVLLDDVTGTGDTAVRVVQALRREGHQVEAVVVVLDRGEGAAGRLAEIDVELSWLFDLEGVCDG
jgi:orotate phosphoribosyltransferase